MTPLLSEVASLARFHVLLAFLLYPLGFPLSVQVELASLEYKASRLVRVVDPRTGKRRGFGLNAETEVVSARWVAGSSCGDLPAHS